MAQLPGVYSYLIQHGFRRSGKIIYRPHCAHCQLCYAARVPVAKFQPDRSQRRIWQRNQDITVHAQAPEFNPEHYQLFQRYTAVRHAEGGMASHSASEYIAFLTTAWCETRFYEFRWKDRLVAVAVVDIVAGGWSAVYTFYEPELPARGLGVYAVLWQLQTLAQQHGDWLYLGYWVPGSLKMDYKKRYQPLECLVGHQWQPQIGMAVNACKTR